MFVLDAESQTFWFNPSSLESSSQFRLVGIVRAVSHSMGWELAACCVLRVFWWCGVIHWMRAWALCMADL